MRVKWNESKMGVIIRIIWKRKKPTVIALSFLLFLFFIASGLSGCGSSGQEADAGSIEKSKSIEAKESNDVRWKVVATTTMLADLISEIAGTRAEVTGLMGPGIDPHLYQASAGDVTSMQEADIVIYNGLHLEGKMGEVFESLKSRDMAVFCVEEGIAPERLLADQEGGSVYDPHIWFDVQIWKEAADYLAKRFIDLDPEGEVQYRENLAAYLEELENLDGYIRERILEVPEQQRVLITAHDAFQYFGSTYGFEVKGIQGISTDAEAGTADVSELAAFIAERQIRAVFVESSVPAKTIEALQEAVAAQGFQVEIGGELYSDSLGDESLGHNSYTATFRANIDTIVDALK